MKNLLIVLFVSLFFLTSCGDDDPVINTGDFTVTIQNVFEAKDYFNSGTTDFIEPGMSSSFTFNAGPGHYFQFATMFVQSNDLFYAPGDAGIALYDNNGNALTGDITNIIDLWDAGTEVNEEPGVGENQAPRQTGPDTGLDENGSVQLITNVMDGYNYPTDEDVIQVMLQHDGGTMFTVVINNVSTGSALPTPLAPGTWVIHSDGQNPMFMEGSQASIGLERIAEDGNNTMMDENLQANSGLVSPFAPGAYSIGSSNSIFTLGSNSSAALEALSEDGDPSGFTNAFNTPDNASSPAPIFPLQSYSFSFSAEEGDKLSLATMFVQSNDWFVGIDGIDLFNNGIAISGDITDQAGLYDSGTEDDMFAGAGHDQAPRQSGGNTGADENGSVNVENNAGINVPQVSDYIKITITNN